MGALQRSRCSSVASTSQPLQSQLRAKRSLSGRPLFRQLHTGWLAQAATRVESVHRPLANSRACCMSVQHQYDLATRSAAKVDMELVAYDWRARGFTCDLWTDPPALIWQGYKTKTDGVFMLVEGEVVIEMNNELVRPAVGQEVALPAHVSHTVHNVGGGTARWLYGFQPRHTIGQHTGSSLGSSCGAAEY